MEVVEEVVVEEVEGSVVVVEVDEVVDVVEEVVVEVVVDVVDEVVDVVEEVVVEVVVVVVALENTTICPGVDCVATSISPVTSLPTASAA